MNKKKAQTIRGKFLRVTVPLIFLTVIGVFSVVEIMTHTSAIRRLNESLNSMIDTQSAALAGPLWNLDNEQIRLSLEAVVTNRQIIAARVYGEDKELLHEAGDTEDLTEKIVLRRDIVYQDGAAEKNIGQLEFVGTAQLVWEQTWLRLVIAAGIAIVAVAMEIAAALYGLKRIIGVPLEKLLASIKRSSSGQEREKVIWDSNDELGQVISAFNEMQSRQAAYENQLQDARDTLENRVAERTAELAEKSNALEMLSNQLAKYLSPQVYESIFTGRQEVKVTSSRKKLTVFFSDIADFTETADKLESEELTVLLNEYLTEMSAIALNHGATIDKYIGDAILIFFGDPETLGVKEDALACVRMATVMRDKMHDLQKKWRASGIEKPMRCRMGIHTDYCTVGNFGSEDRMDYTIIGGGVNIASRLESIAYPGEILISYETFAHVSEDIICEEKGNIEVKGIAYPIATYSVVDIKENLTKQQQSFYEEDSSVKVELELAAMTDIDRTNAARILKRALSLVEQKSDTN